jgi:hypothetical protein
MNARRHPEPLKPALCWHLRWLAAPREARHLERLAALSDHLEADHLSAPERPDVEVAEVHLGAALLADSALERGCDDAVAGVDQLVGLDCDSVLGLEVLLGHRPPPL